jgi:serine/threonine protein kinase
LWKGVEEGETGAFVFFGCSPPHHTHHSTPTASKYNNNKGSIYMVFDYMDHDLAGLMERRGYALPVPHAKCYMKQLLRGLHYCHSKHVLHRDLKVGRG